MEVTHHQLYCMVRNCAINVLMRQVIMFPSKSVCSVVIGPSLAKRPILLLPENDRNIRLCNFSNEIEIDDEVNISYKARKMYLQIMLQFFNRYLSLTYS